MKGCPYPPCGHIPVSNNCSASQGLGSWRLPCCAEFVIHRCQTLGRVSAARNSERYRLLMFAECVRGGGDDRLTNQLLISYNECVSAILLFKEGAAPLTVSSLL